MNQTIRAARSREEQEALLMNEEQAEDSPLPASDGIHVPNPHAELPVYISIHRIRRLIIASIDDPYSLEQLKSPRMNVAVVRPLVEHLYNPKDVSTGFEPFQNAPEEVAHENQHALHWAVRKHFWRDGYERTLTALEVAIISESKIFLSSSACRKIVDAVYRGRIVYTPTSFIDILPDHYKYKPISLYDPRKSPMLNQYRLIVPMTRNVIEVCQFFVLLVLYMLTMIKRHKSKVDVSQHFPAYELFFCIYSAGWALDEFASVLEHGWQVHTENLWSFLDIAFLAIYGLYFSLRMHGLGSGNIEHGQQALDILAIGAPILLPRLALNLMPENMLFISLRAMMVDFTFLTLLAVWCFAGLLLAMRWLSNGTHESITISKWMLWIWFGLDGTGIQRSTELHRVLGPMLMVTFAFLGNTLFLTILVSMLSNTFSNLAANATAEIQFRRAVLTFEGVKSDAIFAYRPPFNILALMLLLPLKFTVSPRWFHKINVTAIRTLNAPILLFINLYERRTLWKPHRHAVRGPQKRTWLGLWERFSVHGDLQA
ncbi:hypothetical protein B0A49_06591, partial [Cryomyces minteri]